MRDARPRVLFAVIPERGHLNPCIGVAQHLVDLGAKVAFAAPANIAGDVAAAGFDTFFGPGDRLEESGREPEGNRGAAFAARVRDPVWLRAWIKQLLIDEAADGVDLFAQAIASFDPDVVVIDPMLYPAIFAAAANERPWIGVSNSLNPVLDDRIHSDLLDTVDWLTPDRAALFARHRVADIEFRGCDALSPQLNIAFCTPALTGREVPGVEQVGPARTPRSRGDDIGLDLPPLDHRPLLYCSFGSQVFHQPERFARIIEATADRDVQVVMALHDLVGTPPFDRLPDNVHACRYAPQWWLLERAAAVITHGGANTVMEALATSTAVLVDPICNDQFHQAWFVEQARVGRTIDVVTSTPASLWNEIQWALELDVEAVAASYQVDGSARAAALILNTAEERIANG